MADKFVAGVAPTPAERNKRTIMSGSLAERDGLSASEKKKGTHFYVDEQLLEYVWNGTSWLPVGGGSVDYPNWDVFEGKDHFNRLSLEPTSAVDRYVTGGDASSGIYTNAQDEFYSHAVTTGTSGVTNNDTFTANQYLLWYAKSDKDRSITKVVIKFRVKLSRLASFNMAWGLVNPQVLGATMDITNVLDKIIIGVLGTGNFFARVANGTTESTLDMGASDDSVHDWEIIWQSGTIEFKKDGTSQGSITTNLPDVPLSPIPIWCKNNTGGSAGANRIIVDYWHYRGE